MKKLLLLFIVITSFNVTFALDDLTYFCETDENGQSSLLVKNRSIKHFLTSIHGENSEDKERRCYDLAEAMQYRFGEREYKESCNFSCIDVGVFSSKIGIDTTCGSSWYGGRIFLELNSRKDIIKCHQYTNDLNLRLKPILNK